MISVGRLLLSGGERGRSHREDTTIPTQWREGRRIPRPGRIPTLWREEGYQGKDTNTVVRKDEGYQQNGGREI